jgi:hypothetical protein
MVANVLWVFDVLLLLSGSCHIELRIQLPLFHSIPPIYTLEIMVHLRTFWVNRIGGVMSFAQDQFSVFFYFGNA